RARPEVIEERDRHVLRGAEEDVPQDGAAEEDGDRVRHLRAGARDERGEESPDRDVAERPVREVDDARGIAPDEEEVAEEERAHAPDPSRHARPSREILRKTSWSAAASSASL